MGRTAREQTRLVTLLNGLDVNLAFPCELDDSSLDVTTRTLERILEGLRHEARLRAEERSAIVVTVENRQCRRTQ